MKDTNKYSYCNIVGDTDVGCKRMVNEDYYNYFECQNGLIAVVCDGMGGHVGGAVASHLAVETIQVFLEENYFDDPQKAIVEACNAANSAILQRTYQQPELTGMGSTCVLLIVRNGKVYIGSVGDSRIYLVRNKIITQLTTDQSYVQMLVDEGIISKDEAEHHPRRNEITNALGLPSMQPATVRDPIDPEAGDCFLLCSDGLSGMVSDNEINNIVSNQSGMKQQERVATLIQRARSNGGLDNITSLIVEFALTPTSSTDRNFTSYQILRRYVLPCVAIFILLLIVGFIWKNFYKKGGGESEYVPGKQCDEKQKSTLVELDSILVSYTPGYTFAVIDALGTKLEIFNPNGKIDTTLTLNSLEFDNVEPRIFTQLIDVDSSRTLSFKDAENYAKDIYLTFKKEDSTFVYKIPIKNPLRDNPNNQDNNNSVENTETTPLPQANTDSNDGGEKLERTHKIDSTDDTSTVVVYAESGTDETDSNKNIYYAGTRCCMSTEKTEEDKNWYSYSYDSEANCCTIKITNKSVPSDNESIKIPFKGCEDCEDCKDCETKHFTINITKK